MFFGIFRRAAAAALESPNIVIGTITLGGGDFIQAVKNREDIEIIEVTAGNRDSLPGLILKKVDRLGSAFYGGTNLVQPFIKAMVHFREMGQSATRILVFLSDGESVISG